MTRSSPKQASATIAAACIATAMLMLDISVINTALSKIAEGLSTGLSGLQWIVDGYTVPLAAVVLTAGALADRFGRRRGFAVGLILFTGASTVCGLSGSIALLDGARAIQGIGAAVMFATSLALIADVTATPAQRGKALALYGATIGGAFAAGPFVGGVLTDALGWRSIFLVNLPLGLAALAMTVRYIGESRDDQARGVDWLGQATLVAGLFALVFGLLRANESGWSSVLVLASLIAGASLLAAFGMIELTRREPMLPLQLFRHRDFAGAQLSVFAVSSSLFAIFLYLSLYLQGPLGRSPLQTGLAYLPGTTLMFLASAATPKISARIGDGALATLGMTMVTGGTLLLLIAGTTSSWTAILPGTMVGFTGVGLYNPAMSVIALSALSARHSGLASGAYDTFRQAGLALGTAALGALVPASALTRATSGGFVSGLHHAELVAAAVAAVGTIVTAGFLMRRRVPALQVVPDAVEA